MVAIYLWKMIFVYIYIIVSSMGMYSDICLLDWIKYSNLKSEFL